jgi:hypothetical protein
MLQHCTPAAQARRRRTSVDDGELTKVGANNSQGKPPPLKLDFNDLNKNNKNDNWKMKMKMKRRLGAERIYFELGPGLSLLVECTEAHCAALALLASEDGLPVPKIRIIRRQMGCVRTEIHNQPLRIFLPTPPRLSQL